MGLADLEQVESWSRNLKSCGGCGLVESAFLQDFAGYIIEDECVEALRGEDAEGGWIGAYDAGFVRFVPVFLVYAEEGSASLPG